MIGEEHISKKNRVKKLERRFSKTSGTLSGQRARVRTAKGYSGRREAGVKIKFD